MKDRLSRRQFLKNAAGLAIAGSTVPILGRVTSHAEAADLSEKIDLAVVKSTSPEAATVAAVEALGGIGKFVRSGDVVVIKPNMAFPNPPNWASTTNPEVVLAMAKLCLDADARLILIMDYPMSRPELCLKRTGVAAACEKLGSKKVRVSMEIEQRDYKEVKLEKAKALEKTQVHKALLRADVFINIPVAKSHSATSVSFGMKNIMGLIWDRRYLHDQIDLHQGIADLSTFIKPSLILVDATKILTTGGPQGPGRAEKLNTIIMGANPVATDSYAVTLSAWNNRQYAPKDVEHIAAAHAMGLGEMDISKLNIKQMES
ncbi:DUF362 domain-containing protein [Candidatus Poribacteria bacterium]